VPYLSTSELVIHKEVLYQVYAPLPLQKNYSTDLHEVQLKVAHCLWKKLILAVIRNVRVGVGLWLELGDSRVIPTQHWVLFTQCLFNNDNLQRWQRYMFY